MGIFQGGNFPGGNCPVGIIRVAIFYCLNITVCEFDNFSISTVNTIKKKLSSCTKWANKVHFY